MTHREIVLSTRSFGTQWGKIHTTFLLSGGIKHTYPMSRGWNGKDFYLAHICQTCPASQPIRSCSSFSCETSLEQFGLAQPGCPACSTKLVKRQRVQCTTLPFHEICMRSLLLKTGAHMPKLDRSRFLTCQVKWNEGGALSNTLSDLFEKTSSNHIAFSMQKRSNINQIWLKLNNFEQSSGIIYYTGTHYTTHIRYQMSPTNPESTFFSQK